MDWKRCSKNTDTVHQGIGLTISGLILSELDLLLPRRICPLGHFHFQRYANPRDRIQMGFFSPLIATAGGSSVLLWEDFNDIMGMFVCSFRFALKAHSEVGSNTL